MKQIKEIDDEKIAELKPKMIKGIDARTFGMLKPDAITGFTRKQFKKVSADQLNVLQEDQIQAIDEEAIPGLKKKVLKKVDDDLLSYFSNNQLNAFKDSHQHYIHKRLGDSPESSENPGQDEITGTWTSFFSVFTVEYDGTSRLGGVEYTSSSFDRADIFVDRNLDGERDSDENLLARFIVQRSDIQRQLDFNSLETGKITIRNSDNSFDLFYDGDKWASGTIIDSDYFFG